MSFQTAKATLSALFAAEGFMARAGAGEQHTIDRLLETCSTGTQFLIKLPGHKALRNDGKVQYDYRIDIRKNSGRTALTHANIIVELYHKVTSGAVPAQQLAGWLRAFAVDGEFNPAVHREPGKCVPPPQDVLRRVMVAHELQNKRHNARGNQWGLTIEELLIALKWIVLQEDFNYPISRGLQGRKMCFARYLEAVYAAARANARLEEVIARTLSHSGRHEQWPEVNYAFLNDVT